MKKQLLLGALALNIACMGVEAASISADATGLSSDEADFWGVSFDSGSGYIESVTFDLSPLTASGFNVNYFGIQFQPGVDLLTANANGLDPSTTFPYIGQTSLSSNNITSINSSADFSSIQFEFEANSFAQNDFFRFTLDTDNTFKTEPVPGLTFGGIDGSIEGLLFSVVMQDGAASSGDFAVTNSSLGSASASGITLNTPSAVPVPAAVWLFSSGLLAIAGRRKRLLAA